MALLQSSHGVLSRPYGVPVAIPCTLTALSLHFHGALNVCTVLSQHLHCPDGLLKMQSHLKIRKKVKIRKEYNHVPQLTKDTVVGK